MPTLGSSVASPGTVGAEREDADRVDRVQQATSDRPDEGSHPGDGTGGTGTGGTGAALVRTRVLRRLHDRLSAPTRFDGSFTPLARRLGLVYVCVTIPFVTVVSAWIDGQREYILAFVVLASGAFTTPALVVNWMALRRTPVADRLWARSSFAGLVLTYLTGVGLLIGLATDWRAGNVTGGPAIAVISGLFIMTIMGLVRSRSGYRALSVDVLEGAMALVVIIAPGALVWGERVLDAEADWFVLPAALALIAVVAGVYWSIVLFVRLGPGAGVLETSFILLTLVGCADAAAQVAQGISGFVLPAPPLIALHATCMAMLLVVPLHTPCRPVVGLDRLPPQAQVRGAGLVALVTLAGVPVLLAVTAWTAGRNAWATPFALGALALLLVLGALRHLATVRETRRLYAQVEQASEERRALLARVMERADEDRHRVAAQLHEQAVSAYASFVSFIQACGGRVGAAGPTGSGPGLAGGGGDGRSAAASGGASSPLAGASTLVRDDLARHADSLRNLMLAIQPLESSGRGSETLAAPIYGYLDSLYGDRRAPRLTVSVQDGLVLDWISETIALRIVQEAVRNVWRHSEASDVAVSIGMTGGVVELRVVDDGVGFDPDAALFESGIGAMRSFAAVLGGSASVTSAPGEGTTVTARLGAGGASGPTGPTGASAATGAEDAATAAEEGEPTPAVAATAAELDAGRPRLRLVRGRGVSR
jgi:signal transduction histidine kinase